MKKFVVFVMIMSIFIPSFYVNGYEFQDQQNSNAVNNMITQIYDSRQQYEDLVGDYNENRHLSIATSEAYWWPVGSLETTEQNGKLFATGTPSTTLITSLFGAGDGFRVTPHGGLDIGGQGKTNYHNVIAPKAGVVIYPANKSQTQFPDNGYYGNKDGGGYGNYIIIQHSDGIYTLYGHLAYDSIKVFAGDTVEQGQVIAKIGHSGNSTGPHLHFEVRTGPTSASRVDPLDYISAEDPRPIGVSVDGFSLTNTTLTRDEFIAKMNDYCNRTNNKGFCNNFASNAGEVYDASLRNNINPELVVVTAGTEQGWKPCGNTNNYWGIGIYNGKGCSSGAHYSNLSAGIAGYASVISSYMPGGSHSALIEQTYKKRLADGADPNGIGMPGTYAGMQMIYSSLGKHEYGSPGAGGYYYMDPSRAGVTTIYSTHEEFEQKCHNAGGVHASGKPVTSWEQSRYTIFQMEGKNNLRNKIFGI